MDTQNLPGSQQEEVDAGSTYFNLFRTSVEQSAKLPSKRDDLYYNMQHANRGRCIILNFKEFELDLNKREGTDVDAQTLYNTFSLLKFEVEVHTNLTYSKTFEILETESARNHSLNDCFVMCVLTHGSNGILYCKDKEFNTDQMFAFFTGDRCRTLIGKPKIFFIQACQGDNFDSGTLVHDSLARTSNYVRIPNYADFLTFYSTYPGFFSWRNIKEGSWFIQSLCKTLQQYSDEHDLVTMLTIVCQTVAYGYQSNVPNNPQMDKKKQIPCIMSTLTRLLKL